MELGKVEKGLLKEIAGLEKIPQGAYNIRDNGKLAGRNTTANIDIQTKKDKPGIDIFIRSSAQGERVDIPVILTETGLNDLVYNDFYVEDGADVTIVAGCGIHNAGGLKSEHDGIHSFHIGKNARVLYIEKHYGEGEGTGERILNPTTLVEIAEGGCMTMETAQIKGVDSAIRKTDATLADGATLVIREKILTHGKQYAETNFHVALNGKNSGAYVVSRAIAKDRSHQKYISCIDGNNLCSGHTECDAIVMDEGTVTAKPELNANCVDASLIHEAAIGKIAGEQLIKLTSLGLDEKQAEERIVNGFLK